MRIVCPKCNLEVAEVDAFERLILTVHCPFDGHDFGVAVDPKREPVAEVVAGEAGAPGTPSAADLDAAAVEQKAVADTAK